MFFFSGCCLALVPDNILFKNPLDKRGVLTYMKKGAARVRTYPDSSLVHILFFLYLCTYFFNLFSHLAFWALSPDSLLACNLRSPGGGVQIDYRLFSPFFSFSSFLLVCSLSSSPFLSVGLFICLFNLLRSIVRSKCISGF